MDVSTIVVVGRLLLVCSQSEGATTITFDPYSFRPSLNMFVDVHAYNA